MFLFFFATMEEQYIVCLVFFFLQLDDVCSILKLGLLLLEQKIKPYF